MNLWAPIAAALFVIGLGLAVMSGLSRGGLDIATKGPETLESFGQANAECRQWSDGCSTCKRQADGSFGCSTPGIACQPSSVTCNEAKQAAHPAGVKAKPAR